VPDKERRFNNPLLFSSSWREAPIVAQHRQLSVGSYVSTPLAVAARQMISRRLE
jgi:hypothetical protein